MGWQGMEGTETHLEIELAGVGGVIGAQEVRASLLLLALVVVVVKRPN